MARKHHRSFASLAVDAVGIAHFVIANAVVLLGESTSLLDRWGGNEHPGVYIVYRYLDAPVAGVLGMFTNTAVGGDNTYPFLVAELVIILSSMLYGGLAYLLMRVFGPADRK
jgi:hypothetical protein